ncbi:MAG: ISAs1 family transposase [Chloroflexi bacterium]|nr:ISAs1 family transposase [Chloroflexota bacterium]
MPSSTMPSLLTHFENIEDPRSGPALLHPLVNIIAIAICGVICGADDWTEVEEFGQAKYEWLKRFLDLTHGIPSHDTFGRVFGRLDAQQFEEVFMSWVQTVAEKTQGQVIAIDGKTVRRSHDQSLGKKAIHMVSAWASANRLVLGQVKVDEKSNEITAIPALLRVLDLSGCIVTIDAMGCQKEIAAQVIDQEGDYVLAVKDNQPQLSEKIAKLFVHSRMPLSDLPSDDATRTEKGHGRLETRSCQVLDVREWLYYLDTERAWAGLRSIVRVTARRQVGEERSEETRYFISSLPCDAPRLLQVVRDHWGVENGLHWVLDLAFQEDASRIRKDNSPENFSRLRRLALNLLRNEKTAKVGIKAKRRRAGWDEQYLLKVLSA